MRLCAWSEEKEDTERILEGRRELTTRCGEWSGQDQGTDGCTGLKRGKKLRMDMNLREFKQSGRKLRDITRDGLYFLSQGGGHEAQCG